MAFDTTAIQEAFRRRAGLGPRSTSGIPGGAPVANAPSAQNPLTSLRPPSAVSAPSVGPGIRQLGKSAPGEAELIIKALSQRLQKIPPSV